AKEAEGGGRRRQDGHRGFHAASGTAPCGGAAAQRLGARGLPPQGGDSLYPRLPAADPRAGRPLPPHAAGGRGGAATRPQSGCDGARPQPRSAGDERGAPRARGTVAVTSEEHMSRWSIAFVAAAVIVLHVPASAHHSFAAYYLESDTIDIDGEVVEFQYKN